jgi:uncharacterized phosphosugar-binding protein
MLAQDYFNQLTKVMQNIKQHEMASIRQAASWIAESVAQDGLVHLFGCGHSHLLAEDIFYRAGGLVPVNAILESSLMLHEGAVKSSKVERLPGYAELILDNYTVKPGEVMIIISNSGINSLPVEMAMAAKAKGLMVVAVSSGDYKTAESRHPSGKRLRDVADLVIDNHVPFGDALVQMPGSTVKIASGSTIAGSLILNMIMVTVVEQLLARQIHPPVFMSGNVPGGFMRWGRCSRAAWAWSGVTNC